MFREKLCYDPEHSTDSGTHKNLKGVSQNVHLFPSRAVPHRIRNLISKSYSADVNQFPSLKHISL